jgi:hypothetical protein
MLPHSFQIYGMRGLLKVTALIICGFRTYVCCVLANEQQISCHWNLRFWDVLPVDFSSMPKTDHTGFRTKVTTLPTCVCLRFARFVRVLHMLLRVFLVFAHLVRLQVTALIIWVLPTYVCCVFAAYAAFAGIPFLRFFKLSKHVFSVMPKAVPTHFARLIRPGLLRRFYGLRGLGVAPVALSAEKPLKWLL